MTNALQDEPPLIEDPDSSELTFRPSRAIAMNEQEESCLRLSVLARKAYEHPRGRSPHQFFRIYLLDPKTEESLEVHLGGRMEELEEKI